MLGVFLELISVETTIEAAKKLLVLAEIKLCFWESYLTAILKSGLIY